MEYYPTHARHKKELYEALKHHSELVDEMVELFQKTQPSSLDMEKEGRTQGNPTDKMDSYIIKKENLQLDARVAASRDICNEMIQRLDNDERVLRMSMEQADRIYVLRYIDKISPADIASKLHYGQSYVYRMLREIEKKTR